MKKTIKLICNDCNTIFKGLFGQRHHCVLCRSFRVSSADQKKQLIKKGMVTQYTPNAENMEKIGNDLRAAGYTEVQIAKKLGLKH